MMGTDVPAERFARTLAALLARCRPAATETAPDRVLMRESSPAACRCPAPTGWRAFSRGNR